MINVPLQIVTLHTKSLYIDSMRTPFPLIIWQWSNGMQGVRGSKGIYISNLVFGFVHYHIAIFLFLPISKARPFRGGQGYQESCYIVSLFTWNDICWYFVLVHTVIVRILNPMPQDMRKYDTNSWHTQMALVVSSTYFIPKYHLVVIDTKSIGNYLS